MLKDYLTQNNISIYSLSKKANIPYSTLNDLCNGKVEIENCKLGLVIKIANALNINVEQLRDICQNEDSAVLIEEYNTYATIKVKNKRYYVEYKDGDAITKIDLFKVNNASQKYVKDAAMWLVEDDLIEKELEDLYALRINEKE